MNTARAILLFIAIVSVLRIENKYAKLHRKYTRTVGSYEAFIERYKLREEFVEFKKIIDKRARLESRVHAIPKDDLFHRDTK